MIILEQLTFSNMYSYGKDNNLILNKEPITQLTAPNGSGKSSLALIIQELLYSKNVKGIKKADIINRYLDTKKWDGKLQFTDSDSGKKYSVHVSRTGASAKIVLMEGTTDISEHKVPDTYKKIKSILGMDFEIFSQLTYQSSIDLLEFLKATDTNRKKFLINLFNLERYINIGEIIKLKTIQVEKENTLYQGEARGIEQFLAVTKIPEKQEHKVVPEINNSLIERKGVLKLEIENHETYSKKIDKNNLYLKEQNNLVFDIKLQESKSPFKQKELDTLSSEGLSLTKQIQDKITEAGKLDLADICYACKQPIDNTIAITMKKQLEQSIDNLGAELYTINNEYETKQDVWEIYESEVKKYNINKRKIERFEQLSQLIDKDLPVNHTDIVEIRNELSKIDNILSEQTSARDSVLHYNEQVNTHNTKAETLRDQKRTFLARQHLLNNDIINIKDQISNLSILRKAFSTSGIVAFKLENLTKELEDTINSYLAELSDGQFQVIFRLTGEKLNIIVRNHGIETPIETVSGGEFSRIQTAVLLAVRNLLSKIGGNTVNLMFLDEISGVLDDAGKEKLIDVLRKEHNLNVFLISHDFEHPLIDKIEIKKENNISRII